MRWKLGNYTVKYNPKSSTKSWSQQNQPTINMNGEVSNPNLIYNGNHKFSIDVYEKPTHSVISSITGSYIGATEKRVDEHIYLLKTGGAFDIKGKDNTLYGSHTIVSGSSVSLPSGSPSAINHWDSGLVFIYPSSSQSSVLVTDENGVANRKYIYNSDDLKYGEDICWDYNSNWLALNPYGKIYQIDTSTGASSFLYQFDDYSSNLSGSKKRYTSIFMYNKNGQYYIGVLQDGKDIIFIDYVSLDVVCKSETKLCNVLAVSYSNYSDNMFTVFSSKINRTYVNTCRIDIEYLKSVLGNSQLTIYDEMNMPSILMVKDITIDRDSNSNEARYNVEINADIAYNNIGYGNKWSTSTRTI